MFPVRWLMRDEFRSDLIIGCVHIPLLMVHGTSDEVPIESAKRLYELTNEPRTFISVHGGGHLVLELAGVFPRVCGWMEAQTLQGPF
jgi:uncharacterized protein